MKVRFDVMLQLGATTFNFQLCLIFLMNNKMLDKVFFRYQFLLPLIFYLMLFV